MAKTVRLIDIANACGVTKGLVSRALAGKYNVGDETRNLIMQKLLNSVMISQNYALSLQRNHRSLSSFLHQF